MSILICGYLWTRDKATWIVSTIALTPGFSIQAVLEVNSSFQQSRGYLEVTVNSISVAKPVAKRVKWCQVSFRLTNSWRKQSQSASHEVIKNRSVARHESIQHGASHQKCSGNAGQTWSNTIRKREPCYPRANRDHIHPYLGFHNMSWVRMPFPTSALRDQPCPSPLVWSSRWLRDHHCLWHAHMKKLQPFVAWRRYRASLNFMYQSLWKRWWSPSSVHIWNADLLKMGTKMYQAQSWMTHNYICFKTVYPKIRMFWPEKNHRPKTCQDMPRR